jgi:plastocyanin
MSASLKYGRAALAVALASVACGGSGGSTPTSPTPSGGGGTAAAVTINIVATTGAQSFSPNPATMTQSNTVAWQNSDGLVHRIVANDGSFDTGDIAPGATSRAIQPPTAGANYHCSIHPAMVGAIGSQGQPPPPCTGQYCD